MKPTVSCPSDSSRSTANGYKDGFTLLEIIIAISIFAIVIGTLVSAYYAIFIKADVVQAGLNDNTILNQSLRRMTMDLRSLFVSLPPTYSPPTSDDPPDDYRVVGDISSIDGQNYGTLRFTSSEHLSMEGSHKIGVAEIVYYVHMTDRDGLVLRRADHLYPFPEFKPSDKDPVLAKHIHSLSFAFFDDEGNAHESWDSDSEEFGYATPRAIAINIGLPGKSEPKLFGTKISLPIYREAKK